MAKARAKVSLPSIAELRAFCFFAARNLVPRLRCNFPLI